MPLYIVECISTHKLYYAIRSEKKKTELNNIIKEKLADGTLENFAQRWAGEKVESVNEVTEEEFIKRFNRLNVSESNWDEGRKLKEATNVDANTPNMLDDEELL